MSFGEKIRKDVEWGEITKKRRKKKWISKQEKRVDNKGKTSVWLIAVEGKKIVFRREGGEKSGFTNDT